MMKMAEDCYFETLTECEDFEVEVDALREAKGMLAAQLILIIVLSSMLIFPAGNDGTILSW